MKQNNNGIIVINKPKDFTSRDIVNIVSKKLKTKKVGHTGTLDPLAQGVLVVCVGRATKLCQMFTNQTKEYVAEVVLGLETDTLDITGETLKSDYQFISRNEIENTLKSFIGTYNQEVPIYSAVKVNGKKLYEYAREGKKVILPKKEVTIYDMKLLDYNYTDKVTFSFKCSVSKGTYIRSLIRDIANSLNTYGTMVGLTRTKQGDFVIETAENIDDEFTILKIKDVLNITKKTVDDNLKYKIINGQKLKNEGKILYLDKNEEELAIYENGKVLKMIYDINNK